MGSTPRMADSEEIETQAKDHSQQVDEGIQKLDQLADEHAGGEEKGLIDGAASAAEREIGGQPQPGSQDQPQAGAQPQPPNQ